MAETIRETPEKIYEAKEGIAPPTYLLSLTVSNFCCFGPSQTLDLSDGNETPAKWTVVLGENGVGKTTLLRCIAGLQPLQMTDYKEHYPVRGNIWATGYFLSNARRRAGSQEDFRVALRAVQNHAESSGMEERFIDLNISGDGNELSTSGSTNNLSGLVFYGYGASRRMSQLALSIEPYSPNFSKTLFSETEDLLNAEEWLIQADYAVKSSEGTKKVNALKRLQRSKDLLTAVLPDIADFRFDTSNNQRMTPRVEAKTPYGWVRVADLSLGYKTALTWMVDFASRLFERYPDSENPLAEPAICLVDEIDLHLHPRWQRELVQKLTETFPNTQFIVTAHSPLIVQAAPNANIALLRREGDHVVIENDVDEIRNWRVDQILTSDLFGLETARPPQVAPALEERRRILSESNVNEADRKRLAELDAIIGELPTGETPADIRSMELMKQAVELLSRGNAGK